MGAASRFGVIGAVVGGVGVAAGAFGAHALRAALAPDLLAVFETGARYQLVHALALLAVAAGLERRPSRAFTAAGWLFVAGIVLFSGSLYALALTGVRTWGAVTPFGGVCFLAGWAGLALGWARGSGAAVAAVALAAMVGLAMPGAAEAPAPPFADAVLEEARAVRDRGLADDTAYESLRSLLTEVGPRFAGSEGDRRAVAWATARLRALGFRNVRTEPVKVPRWLRGEGSVTLLSPWPHELVAVALGGSPGTSPAGVEAEVVAVSNLGELASLPPDRARGRIVFFTNRMLPTLDGSGYGAAVQIRSRGALEASKLGAVGVLIRTIGTAKHRFASTGGQRLEDSVRKIPAFAISHPDADVLERQLAGGATVRARITSTARWADSTMSANVIGEIPGRTRPHEIVLLGAHLDSWDVTPGAHDDGAGVAIVSAAAKIAGSARLAPKRTLRVVLFANEEFGQSGAHAYARDHAHEAARHVLGVESDLGGFPVWGISSLVTEPAMPAVRAMHSVLEPLGIVFAGNGAGGGADIGQMRALGMPVMDVRTDARPYFELHHNADDTFDKVELGPLRQNVAAYATIAFLAAQADTGFGRALGWTPPATATGR